MTTLDSPRVDPTRLDPTRVLVVDDEDRVRDLIASTLRFEGFEVAAAESADVALDELDRFRPGLVVLDTALDEADRIRAHERAPGAQPSLVLYLTTPDADDGRRRGFTLRGSDSLAKPFSMEQLAARIRSMLRRSGRDEVTLGPSRLVFDDLELDEDLFDVRRGGEPIDLTPTEFQLLRFLMRHPRRVVSKAQILDHVWDYEFTGDDNIVETYVSYLRKKLDVGRPPLIHTVRGVGYGLRSPRG